MPLTFTQAEIDAFKEAMLKNPGVLEMDIGDKHYRFENLQAMREQLAYMERNVAGGQAGRTRYAATSKGLPVPAWNDRNDL
jgi:hypothetical protein